MRLWVDGDSMNLLFNLTYPAQQNTTVTIVAATLRLYKLAQVSLLTQLLNTMVQSPCKADSSSASQFPHINGTRSFTTAFTAARSLSQS
jgi:hypothetical protein